VATIRLVGDRGARWVAGHPIAALLVWFFTVGQAIAFIPVVASSAGADVPVQPFTVASTWVGLLLPAVAITWLAQGRDAVRALLSRLSLVKQPLRWYALCLVVVPLTSLAIVTAMVGPPTESSVSDLVRAGLVAFGVHALLHLVMNNLWEELAWTGFVQAQLQARHSPLLAALATAPLFALQHSPLVFGDNSVAGGAVVMLALVGLAVPFRMVMGWVFNRTGSLFLVGLAHACGNAVVTGTVVGDALVQDLFGRSLGPVHLFAFTAIGVVVAVVTKARLGLDEGAPTAGALSGRAAGTARHGA
jgi:membrane protease YdiL (CAAX protease family)